jgi:hypothetical protein
MEESYPEALLFEAGLQLQCPNYLQKFQIYLAHSSKLCGDYTSGLPFLGGSTHTPLTLARTWRLLALRMAPMGVAL